MTIKIGIIGGAGYTGGELIRVLLNHSKAEIVFIHSKSNSGNRIGLVHGDLFEEDLTFSGDEVLNQIKSTGTVDVLFLCMGHGDSKSFVASTTIHQDIPIIDLANDFRLSGDASFKGREFVYGLPELNLEQIKSAKNIANPGCFASAIQLGLLPLAKNNILPDDIYTTGITGSTGAGQKPSATCHFSWRANNIQAYKTLSHQHLREIYQSLNQLQDNFSPSIDGSGDSRGLHFVPWRGDFTRGIFISSTVSCDLSIKELLYLYRNFYDDAVFTSVAEQPIFLKQVVNTNKCVISMEKIGSKVVIHSAIDNLLKGASGQAVQNMNILFGLDQRTGLRLKANLF